MCVRTSTAFYGNFILDMGRSPGFGPACTDSVVPFTLGFPPAPRVPPLNLAGTRSSPDRSTKSTRSHAYGASTACRHRVSGSLSLPSRGPFHLSFTVLCSIGRQVVFSLAGWSPHLPTGFHVPRGTLDPAAPPPASPTGLSPPMAGLPRAVRLAPPVACAVRTPACTHAGLGSSGSARRYSRNHCCFLFLRLLRCFSSPGSPRMPIRGLPRLHHAVAGCFPAGFPHSDTHGSMDICSSPWLFAACRVFLRPLVPRHPPCALSA